MPENEQTASATVEWNKKLQEEAASSAFQLVARLVAKGYDWAKDKIGWERAAGQYVARWIDRWGQIKPLGADHPIPLHQIFVQVRAAPRSFLKRFASVEEMEETLESGGDRSFFGLNEAEKRIYTPQSGMAIANEHRRLNLLGAPGAGKTTFLRRLGLEALLPRAEGEAAWEYCSTYEHQLLPVLLELRVLRGKQVARPEDLVSLVVEEFSNAGFPASADFVAAVSEEGRLLILLDGVDEIPTDQLDLSITAIRDFISRYPKCRYVLSCRTAFYRDWFTGFYDFVLADFDDAQIGHFSRMWFTRPHEVEAKAAGAFLALLLSPDHRATRELAGSPLLLTFLCLVFRKNQEFPANRAQLYQQALLIYLKEWNASKFVHHDPIYKELSPEMELELLQDIAGPAFLENRLFFTGEELAAAISGFLTQELNAPRSLSPSQILNAIAVQQGLLIERAQNVWTFSHLTIQEYMAAAWILKEGETERVIREHAGDNRWREIFLLMAGLLRVDEMLRLMMDWAEGLIKGNSFVSRLFGIAGAAAQAVLKELQVERKDPLDAATGSASAPASLRIFCFREALVGDLAVPNVRDLARELGRDLILDRDHDLDVALNLTRNLPRALARARELAHASDLALNRKAEQSLALLARYMQTCVLICHCKRAALRVSREAWEGICARMLVAPGEKAVSAE